MLVYDFYKIYKQIKEKLTGFPADSSLAQEYLWAWKYTDLKPYKVIWNENRQYPEFFFENKNIAYCCSANANGSYNICGIDMDGFYESSIDFKRRAFLITKYLKMPDSQCTKEEAVWFCAKACNIEKDHPHEKIDYTNFNLAQSKHIPINFF